MDPAEETPSESGDSDGTPLFETNELWVIKMLVDEKIGSTRARSLIACLSRVNHKLNDELTRRGEHPQYRAKLKEVT